MRRLFTSQNDEIGWRRKLARDVVVPHQMVFSLGPVLQGFGELFVVYDHEKIVVRGIAADWIVHPIAPRMRAEQDHLQNPPLLSMRGVLAHEGVLKLGEQDFYDARKLAPLGLREMV